MERIRFTVTQEHIDAAVETTRDGMTAPRYVCPVARALTDRCGQPWGVGRDTARPEDPVDGPLTRGALSWSLSRRVQRAVRDFDDGKPLTPFTGEVHR